MGSMILLDLVGGVALLLWGLHMVHSGIVRAFGSDLRRFLGMALRNRFLAFVAGIFVTALLQSSTATGLMTASFVTGGAVDLAPAHLREMEQLHLRLVQRRIRENLGRNVQPDLDLLFGKATSPFRFVSDKGVRSWANSTASVKGLFFLERVNG